jgi:RNA polymerase sigma-70 factor (ECF subfamily)
MATVTVKMLAMAAQAAPSGPSRVIQRDTLRGKESVIDAAALFRAHGSFVAAFLQRLGISHQECNDLVQEVFLIVHRKGGYRPGEAKPTTWLANVALGVARNFRRRAGRRARLDQERPTVEPGASVADPERAVDTRRSLDLVRQALDRIQEDQRVVIMLHELEGEPLVSIAAGLQVPTGTIYARLHRGRKAFRKAYADLSHANAGKESST